MALNRKKIAFMASGRGTNFAALTDAILTGEIPDAEVVALLCNKSKAPVIQLAEKRSIPVFIVSSKTFTEQGKLNREAYEEALIAVLQPLKPDYICLAGYMLLLGKLFVETWPGKIINIHPSLLPAFKGLYAQKQALDAGVTETGCTIHFVDGGLDSGPIILQSKIAVLPGETEKSLSERLRPVEHATYIEALKKLCLLH